MGLQEQEFTSTWKCYLGESGIPETYIWEPLTVDNVRSAYTLLQKSSGGLLSLGFSQNDWTNRNPHMNK